MVERASRRIQWAEKLSGATDIAVDMAKEASEDAQKASGAALSLFVVYNVYCILLKCMFVLLFKPHRSITLDEYVRAIACSM